MSTVFTTTVLILILFTVFRSSTGNTNVTFIETLKIADNSNVSINAYIPRALGQDLKCAFDLLVYLITKKNQTVDIGGLKIFNNVEIARNNNISLKIYFTDAAEDELVLDQIINFISEISNAVIENLGVKNDKPSSVRNYGTSNLANSSNCSGLKLMVVSSNIDINNSVTGKADDLKVKLLDKLRIALAEKTEDHVCHELMKTIFEPMIEHISQTINTVLAIVHPRNTKLVKTLRTIRRNLKPSYSEKSGDVKSKLTKLKEVSEAAAKEIGRRIQEMHAKAELKAALHYLKIRLVQLWQFVVGITTHD